MYAIAYSRADKAIWGSNLSHPGYIIRLDPGANPPDTALAEISKVPLPGYGIRGMDVNRNGIVWLPLDSGHLASFDRRKCEGPLNGPGAEKGEKCPRASISIRSPGRASRATQARRRTRITSGSIGSTSWVSAPMCLRDRQPVGFDGHFVERRCPRYAAACGCPGAPGATPETLSSPLVVNFQLRPDPLAH